MPYCHAQGRDSCRAIGRPSSSAEGKTMWTAAFSLGVFLSIAPVPFDRAVLQQAWDLLARGGYGYRDDEQAAFIVRDGDEHRFVAWPAQRMYHSATFNGAWPENVVAIIHTHPNNAPSPSP